MKARAVIIGGGVLGLALAYNLAAKGWTDLVVCEKAHLNAGASARNGGGVRAQWSTASNIELMIESQRLFETFTERLGINIWYRQGGYLFLAKTDEQVKSLASGVKLQNEHGVPSRMVTPRQIRRMVPQLSTDGIVAGSFNQKDGVLFPFPVLWGYAKAATERGAKIMPFTPVTGIDVKNGRVAGVHTDKGLIETELVINAAGAWAPEIGRLVGVALPNRPEKHEAVVTEPLTAFLGPNLVPMDTGMYVTQTMRGEIYACVGHETDKVDTRASFAFARYIAGLLTDLLPRLGDVKVLRQWGGYYDITPDTNPILGPVEQPEGFIQFHGFMGHGFMMAPVMARIMADYLAEERSHPMIESCHPDRFEGTLLQKETMIIG